MREKWEVSYARFLTFPSTEAAEDASTACPYLKPRRITKTCKEKGTWLAASSSADLKLIVDRYNADVVMRVLYGGRIMEEHFISRLNIGWLQASCESGFPPRGTRVVAVTYTDETEEVQKFVFQFSTICNLETFLNAIKVYMKEARKTFHTNFSNRSEISTPLISRSLRDIYSRTPLTSLSTHLPFSLNGELERSVSTQDDDTYRRELASISNFNKRRFTSERFYQQAVVEDSRALSCQKLQTIKPVHQKTKKVSDDSSTTRLNPRCFTTNSELEAENDINRALFGKSPEKEKEIAGHQSKMLISFDKSMHIDKTATKNRTDIERISKLLSTPIRWHRSSEASSEDNSHHRSPKMANRESDKASNVQNMVATISSSELEQYQLNQEISMNNHNSPEAFPPSFTAMLTNCLSNSEQAATPAPRSPKHMEDDLQSQIMRYMEDSTFQDMLMKVERVIDELGYVDTLGD